jgi:hypothetical protein
MLRLVPLPPEGRQRPGNLHGWVSLALVEACLHQLQAPVVGIPGGAAVGGQSAPLPWVGVQGEPIGLDHRDHRVS